MQKINELFSLASKRYRTLSLILTLIVIASFLNLVFPFGIRHLFNSIVPKKEIASIPWFISIMLTAFVLRGFVSYLQEKYSVAFASHIVSSFRHKLFEEILHSQIGTLRKKGESQMASLLMEDVQSLYESIKTGILYGLTALFTSFLFFAALCLINLELSCAALVMLPFFLYFFLKMDKTIRENILKTRASSAKLSAFLNEAMHMMSTIRINMLEPLFLKRNKRLCQGLTDRFYVQKSNQALFMALIFFFFMGSFLIVLSYSAYLNIRGEISTGDMMAFYIVLEGLFQPLMTLMLALEAIQMGCGILERIDQFKKELLVGKPESPDFSFPVDIKFSDKKNLAIEVKNLRFSMDGSEILKGIDMEVFKGERILITGLNGSGKSTLINLLTGIYSPYRGEIFILGKNLRLWTSAGLSNIFSLVEQDRFAFRNSLRNNIDPEKKIESWYFKNFLKMADLERFSSGSQLIEDNGRNLSGGEKQRVAFLRAIIKDAPICIFDEAGSSQDAQNSLLIYNFLEKLTADKTFVSVTHQLSIARFVDRIFLLDKGTVAETGSHDQLMRLGGMYYNLYSLYNCERKSREVHSVHSQSSSFS